MTSDVATLPDQRHGSEGPPPTYLDATLRSHPVAMLVLESATLRIRDANAAVTRCLGWSRDALLGMRITELRLGAEPGDNGPTPASGRWSMIRADGNRCAAEAVVADLPGHGGAMLLVTAICTCGTHARPADPTETRLHENEERLRLAMASAGIGTFRRDILADRFEVSPEARRLHGLLPDGPISLAAWLAHAPAEDRAHVMAELAAGWARQAREIPVQYRLVDPVTGRTRHIESRTSYSYDAAGRPLSSIGVIIDITERKERELELMRSEQRHRSIIETAADAIVIADDEGRILSANPATLQMFGHADARTLVGRDIGVLMPQDDADAHPAHVSGHQRGQAPKVIGEPGRQLLGRRADGSTFPIELSVGSFRVGDQAYLTGIVRDVSEREAFQRALVESEERLRLAQDAAGLGVWEADVNSLEMILSERSLELHGLPPDHPALMHCDEWCAIVHPDDVAEARRQKLRAIETGEPFDYVFRVTLPQGGIRWIQSRGRALPSRSGKPHRVRGIHSDVTAQRVLAEQLRTSEETLRLTLEATDQGVWDWDIPSGRALFSDRHCRMRGYEPHEVTHTLAFWADTVHPDDLRRVRASLDAHMAGEAVFYAAEYRVRRRDGTEIWVLDRGKVVAWDSAGRPTRMVGTNQDITARVAMEAALAENERWLRIAQESAGLGTFTADFSTDTVRFSAQSRRLHGMPDDHPEVFARSEWFKWVDYNDATAARALLATRTGPNERVEFAFRVPLPDGGVRWVQALGRHILADAHGGDRFVGVHVDITERRELIERLQRSEETQRLAIEAAGAGVWTYDVPTRHFEVSERAAQIYGETPESFRTDSASYGERVHPDDREWFMAGRDERMAGRVDHFVFQYRVRHREGHWIWISVRGKSIEPDAAGNASRVVGLIQDISSQKAIEMALARSEAQLRAVIDAVPLGIVVVDPMTEILVANPACLDMLGAASANDVIGRPLNGFTDGDELAPMLAQAGADSEAAARMTELTLRRAGRPDLQVECLAVPFQLNERCNGFLAVLTDVTRQRDAASQLRALEAQAMRTARMSAVGAMAAALAHQLNQPLSAATNYANATRLRLAQAQSADEEMAEPLALLDAAIRQIMRVGAIIRGLRDFIGSEDHELATIRIQDLLTDVVRDIEAHHPQAPGATITVQVEPPTLQVYGDTVLLAQVMGNLVRNAVEATAQRPRREVTIVARRHADAPQVEIVVRDTGPGLPANLRKRLFDPVPSDKPEGMGIGLAIARAIAQLHGGSISATDDGLNRGAEFRLTLPSTGDASLLQLR